MTMGRAAAAIGAGGIGRAFFAHLAIAGDATEETAAIALAVAARTLGPVAAIEARRAAGPGLLVQSLHEGGGISQIILRAGGAERIELDLDGDAGSLRLDAAGRLLRHRTGMAEEIAPAIADLPAGDARIATMLHAALAAV